MVVSVGECSRIKPTLMPCCAHQQLLQQFRWEVFDHPADSPDLAPSDYYLFKHLKRFLAKQHFPSDEDVQADGCHRLASLSGGKSLRPRCKILVSPYDTYFSSSGSYVER
ncbi:hypothetical protein AVEN_184079-1 [Araneus ventricosus]|uniref:Histone-lysine N-methyltransferase SETMAR n=1 Tax=Araneus ventricosus TaxID=182803 RepID=A0A4Y2CY26_ARAVE|nr:hypothetical protein AVEN_184079-1 [Araneus ventricosus]